MQHRFSARGPGCRGWAAATSAHRPERTRDNPAAPWRCACGSCRTRPADAQHGPGRLRVRSAPSPVQPAGRRLAFRRVSLFSAFCAAVRDPASSSVSEPPFGFLNAIIVFECVPRLKRLEHITVGGRTKSRPDTKRRPRSRRCRPSLRRRLRLYSAQDDNFPRATCLRHD